MFAVIVAHDIVCELLSVHVLQTYSCSVMVTLLSIHIVVDKNADITHLKTPPASKVKERYLIAFSAYQVPFVLEAYDKLLLSTL
jgi:hypothetical protein